MEDGDSLLTLLEDDGGAFRAIRLKGPLGDGSRELELDAGLARGIGGEGRDERGLSLVFGAEGELLLQGAHLLLHAVWLFLGRRLFLGWIGKREA